MTPDEMKASSERKLQEVLDFMKERHVRVEAKQKMNLRTGFIENVIFWSDDENYPAPAPVDPVQEVPLEQPAPAAEEHLG